MTFHIRPLLAGLALLGASACAVVVPVPAPAPAPDVVVAADPSPAPQRSAREVAQAFVSVIRVMEPAIEQQCLTRRRAPINCDFQFVVDDRPGLGPNAFQTIDGAGRPIIGFTLALVAETRNGDELAFVVAHEAAHHILQHLDQKQRSATVAGVVLGGVAAASGGGAIAVQTAQTLGAQLGVRRYSKQWELEADYLGAIMTRQAGFDPTVGAQFFLRLPDPGDHILGTHPSRSQRLAQVARAVEDYRTGRAM